MARTANDPRLRRAAGHHTGPEDPQEAPPVLRAATATRMARAQPRARSDEEVAGVPEPPVDVDHGDYP
jgi:hypothetical protein